MNLIFPQNTVMYELFKHINIILQIFCAQLQEGISSLIIKNRLVIKYLSRCALINMARLNLQHKISVSCSYIIRLSLLPFKNTNIQNHSCLYYKCYIGNCKANVEVHYYNQIFFMGLINFSHIRDEIDKVKIINILTEKYSLTANSQELANIVILAKNNNLIKLDYDIEFNLKYITGDYVLLETIKQQLESHSSTKSMKEIKINSHLKKSL